MEPLTRSRNLFEENMDSVKGNYLISLWSSGSSSSSSREISSHWCTWRISISKTNSFDDEDVTSASSLGPGSRWRIYLRWEVALFLGLVILLGFSGQLLLTIFIEIWFGLRERHTTNQPIFFFSAKFNQIRNFNSSIIHRRCGCNLL